jgi:Ca2+-binding RTX toxin-like protein
VAVIAALALAAPALATTGAHRSGSTLVITGDAQAQALDFDVDFHTPQEFVIRDSNNGALGATDPCVASSAEIRCPTAGTKEVNAGLGAGGDRFFANAELVATLPFKVFGGPGDDVLSPGFLFSAVTVHGGRGADHIYGRLDRDLLYGGPGQDHLEGIDGDDTLYGEDGPDTLTGGDNRDRLFGGDGNDLLRARDYTQDLRLSCGAGSGDRVRRDPFDPQPTGCP